MRPGRPGRAPSFDWLNLALLMRRTRDGRIDTSTDFSQRRSMLAVP
jgi:hypothetical protein